MSMDDIPTMTTPHYEVDVTSCDREPIHILGAVQEFGFLIAVSSDWVVARVSDNVSQFLGRSVDDLLGASLRDVVGAEAIHRLRGMTQSLRDEDTVERAFSVEIDDSGALYDLAVYASGPAIVIEFDPADHERLDAGATVRTMTDRLKRATTLPAMLHEAARQMRGLTGYDRVMVYQFADDAAGEVVAESVSSGLDPYLGLRYPASDIPKQARALYLRNMLRSIHDTRAEGSAIQPRLGVTGEPLDLSMSMLRAVSPIHLEYLTNMGVRASMSVSIVVDGKLWGLFACHHMEPRRISMERRTAAELFGQIFSFILQGWEKTEDTEYEASAREAHNKLMSAVATSGSTLDTMINHLPRLSEIIHCDGVGAFIDGRIETLGTTPTHAQIEGLIRHVNGAPAGKVHATSQIAQFYPAAEAFVDQSAGVLAIPISRHPRDYLMFFRKEVARTVNWAGDPAKRVTPSADGTRLSPRTSFAAWQETVRGQSQLWTDADLRIAESLRVTLLEVILMMTDEADRERRAAQDRQELLIAELNHRVRNILGLIRGLVTQTQQGAASVEEFAAVIGGRIQALARAHDQVTTNNWEPAALIDLLRSETNAYLAEAVDRVRMAGPNVLLAPEAFSAVALVIHELVTNAAKYGALRDSRGYIDLTWKLDPMGRLVIDWREVGGPAVQAPTRRGFGSTIIERSIPFDLKGEADIRYEVTGLKAHFVIPADHITLDENEPSAGPVETPPAAMGGVEGPALLVEDNMLIALDAEDMLLEMGASNVDVAPSVVRAMRLIEKTTPSFALLDVNLTGETSIPVAEHLHKLGVPFVFATGYGEDVPLPASLAGTPIISKPYTLDILRRTMSQVGSA